MWLRPCQTPELSAAHTLLCYRPPGETDENAHSHLPSFSLLPSFLLPSSCLPSPPSPLSLSFPLSSFLPPHSPLSFCLFLSFFPFLLRILYLIKVMWFLSLINLSYTSKHLFLHLYQYSGEKMCGGGGGGGVLKTHFVSQTIAF